MTIKEQIEIARLIASGTPREVAIMESNAIVKKTNTNIVRQQKAKKTLDTIRKAKTKVKVVNPEVVGGDINKKPSTSSKTKPEGKTVDTTGYQVVDRKPKKSPGRDLNLGPLRRTTVTDKGPAPTKIKSTKVVAPYKKVM